VLATAGDRHREQTCSRGREIAARALGSDAAELDQGDARPSDPRPIKEHGHRHCRTSGRPRRPRSGGRVRPSRFASRRAFRHHVVIGTSPPLTWAVRGENPGRCSRSSATCGHRQGGHPDQSRHAKRLRALADRIHIPASRRVGRRDHAKRTRWKGRGRDHATGVTKR